LSSVFDNHLTTLEMLDKLEAGVEALLSNRGTVDPHGAAVVSPEELRARITAWSLSASQIADTLSVAPETVDDWLNGQAAIPSWVPITIRVIAHLTPSAGRKQHNGTAYHTKTEPKKTETKRCHPFSRIEDL
jgi:hypothetical protein